MRVSETDIENILRSAPRPEPPQGLKPRLLARVQLPFAPGGLGRLRARSGLAGWLQRWWPALIPAGATLACATVLGLQRVQIQDLKKVIRGLTPAAAPANPALTNPPAINSPVSPNTTPAAFDASRPELARLQARADQLKQEIANLERLEAQNTRLRAELAQPAPLALSAEDAAALASAREQAMQTACVNNLKQLGLAAKVWSLDNSNRFPRSVLEMTNEMATPKILVCPADSGRRVASNFSAWSPANMSYEYLAPGASDTEPNRVLFECPVHGNVLLCDGSVQARVARTHPGDLVRRDGKLYLEDHTPPRPSRPSRTNEPTQ
jgi:hypothetical protein